jgi:hypothetical protein
MKLVQQLYRSDSYKQQQTAAIQQVLDSMKGGAAQQPTVQQQPTAAQQQPTAAQQQPTAAQQQPTVAQPQPTPTQQ